MRYRFLIYPVFFITILLGLTFLFENVLGIETGEEEPGYIFYLLMLVSFGIVTYLYNVVERKDYDFTKILRRMASIITYCLLSGVMIFVFIIWWLSYSFYERFIELILVYSIGGAVVAAIAFIIAKIMGSDFKTEMHKIMEFK